jgi:hypothetical protein
MTNQQVFNRVVRFLRKQGCQSITKDGRSCAYRGEGGRRCAVGCLIPNRLYEASMEGAAAEFPRVKKILKALGIDIDLAMALQNVHDSRGADSWEFEFHLVAEEFSLTVPPRAEP